MLQCFLFVSFRFISFRFGFGFCFPHDLRKETKEIGTKCFMKDASSNVWQCGVTVGVERREVRRGTVGGGGVFSLCDVYISENFTCLPSWGYSSEHIADRKNVAEFYCFEYEQANKIGARF